jgi:hypothetical protein
MSEIKYRNVVIDHIESGDDDDNYKSVWIAGHIHGLRLGAYLTEDGEIIDNDHAGIILK